MAVTSIARAALGARSLSLSLVEDTGESLTLTHEQMVINAAGDGAASDAELKSLAIYKDFLNKKFVTAAVPPVADADAMFAAVGALGISASVQGDAANAESYGSGWDIDADGYPLFSYYNTAAGKAVIRISLSSSIAE